MVNYSTPSGRACSYSDTQGWHLDPRIKLTSLTVPGALVDSWKLGSAEPTFLLVYSLGLSTGYLQW
jgi:hypothetical protein